MPRRISLGAATGRATRVFHADWWSDARDPRTGQYLERLVLYPYLNAREAEAIKNEEQEAQITLLLESGLDKDDLKTAMDLVPDDVHAAEDMGEADLARLKNSDAMQAMLANPKLAKTMTRMQADTSSARRKLLYRIHELTEQVAEGDGPECFAPMPLRDTLGRLLPGAEELLHDLTERDLAFVTEAVASLSQAEQRAVVLPTPDDALAAEHTADKIRLGMPNVDHALATAEGAAQESFRPDC